MDRRGFLKGLVGTTIAVSVPFPFTVEEPNSVLQRALRYFRVGQSEPLDWNANFTILKIEWIEDYYRTGLGFVDVLRFLVAQNGHPERKAYAAVFAYKDRVEKDIRLQNELMHDMKASIIQHAKKKGWITREG